VTGYFSPYTLTFGLFTSVHSWPSLGSRVTVFCKQIRLDYDTQGYHTIQDDDAMFNVY